MLVPIQRRRQVPVGLRVTSSNAPSREMSVRWTGSKTSAVGSSASGGFDPAENVEMALFSIPRIER